MTTHDGSTVPDQSDPRQFVTTHWSVVLRAIDDNSTQAHDALSELCRVYWYPLYAFARRQGRDQQDAEDLTQGFFAKLLEKNYLLSVQPDRGRFRSFLLMALKRYMANEWDRSQTLKRGGRESVVSIDAEKAESRYSNEPSHDLSPERIYDQRWAQTLLDEVFTRLENEQAEDGKQDQFDLLRGTLTRQSDALPYLEIAEKLNTTEAAIKMATRRLRQRYRTLLREEIAKTVAQPEEIESELRDLFSTFS